MRQLSFSSVGFDRFGKTTRRAAFLAEMEQVVPWRRLYDLIAPFYPKPGKGRRPVGLDRMLRIYFLQHWFSLSDPAAEEALYDSEIMRRFVGIDLGREPVPDETTILNFRHLLERHELCGQILQEVVNLFMVRKRLVPPVDRWRQLRQRMAHIDDLIQPGAKQVMLPAILWFLRSHAALKQRHRGTESQTNAPR